MGSLTGNLNDFISMTPSSPFGGGVFTVGVSVVTPSLGVNGFTPLVVII